MSIHDYKMTIDEKLDAMLLRLRSLEAVVLALSGSNSVSATSSPLPHSHTLSVPTIPAHAELVYDSRGNAQYIPIKD